MKKNTQAVFLNSDGIKALSHLGDTYIRNGNIIDCQEVSIDNPRYLEVKAIIQRDLPTEILKTVFAHLWIPHNYIDLVVIDEPDNTLGFVQE